MSDVFEYLRSGGKLGYDHPRVDMTIDGVMRRYRTDSKAYYEEVHQHLAPLARELEMENEKLRSLLRRGLKQLTQWQEKYGEFDPKWLPPSGGVRWAEDVDEALTPNNQVHRASIEDAKSGGT